MKLLTICFASLMGMVRSADSTSQIATTFTPSYISTFVVSGNVVIGGSTVTGPVSVPTGSYASYTGQSIVSTTSSAQNISRNGTTIRTHQQSNTILVGSVTPTSSNQTTTATSTSAMATNTQPCNGYPEFCNRKYSNITNVCAHNSAFVRSGNAASNQAIPILGQLNDGIRMIQGETHLYNGSMYSCHTSCDILNAGPLVNELATVAQWVEANPYEVVTILLVNSDYVNVENYTQPILESGLEPYLYIPPKIPMKLDDWPTLGDMILKGTRVVIFMDYNANQTKVPYVLDEFSQMWETPFSPTDLAFPCTQQRPPGLAPADARNDYLYLLNQNLNIELSLLGQSILIPNFAYLSETNAVSGYQNISSLGNTTKRCTADWGRPPNFLLVDFYNYGNFNGSVFEVAARYNNVTYNRKAAHCCGLDNGISAASLTKQPMQLLGFALVAGIAWEIVL